jgi:hypothetical protein
MRRLPFVFYNLGPPNDPHRDPVQVGLELNALANNSAPTRRRTPKVVGICEAIGHNLPELERFQQVRDRTNRPRANIALYVRDHLDLDITWVELTRTWPRTQAPGNHEPRANLIVTIDEWTIMVGHAPPKVPGAADARAEWLDSAVEFLHGPGPRVVLSDPNLLRETVVETVANGVMALGTQIESVHGRSVVLDRVRTREVINDVRMMSDHKRALLGRATRESD